MTTLRQAAQQALEALDKLSKLGNGDCDGNSIGNSIAQKAREKLRTALAQEHAMHDLARLGQEIEQAEPISTNKAMRDAKLNAGWGSEQQAEPVQEQKYEKRIAPYSTTLSMLLNTAPPQQQAEPPPEWPLVKNILAEYGLDAISFVAEWKAAQRKPLTNEGINDIAKNYALTSATTPLHFARAIEAAHGIKEGTSNFMDALKFDVVMRPWVGLTDEDWEKVANRKNTVLDTFEQGATWAAYKLERRNT